MSRSVQPRWFTIPEMWWMDGDMMKLTVAEQAYFLRILGYSRHFESGGRIAFADLPAVNTGLKRARELMRGLCDKGVMDFDVQAEVYAVRNVQKWLPDRAHRAATAQSPRNDRAEDEQRLDKDTDNIRKYPRTVPAQSLRTPKSIPAGQTPDDLEKGASRALKRERETEKKDSVRSEGTERTESSSARSAPHRAGGTARPAPKNYVGPPVDDDSPADKFDGIPEEFRHLKGPALTRAILSKGKDTSKVRTGRDTKLRKYEWEPTKVNPESTDQYWDRRDREAGYL